MNLGVMFIAARQGLETYSFSTPFGQIVSLRSQSVSKALRVLRNSLLTEAVHLLEIKISQKVLQSDI